MRITESKLRSVIRSVLIEGEKGLKHYKKKWEKIKTSEKAKILDGYEEIAEAEEIAKAAKAEEAEEAEEIKKIKLNSLRGFILDYEDIHGKIRLEDK